MEQSSSTANQQFVVGIVRASHGLTGKFKVESTSGECEHFANFTEVTLRNGNITRKFDVESVEGCVSSLLMKCAGINSADDAAKYRNWEILVPRDMACPLNKDEYYVEDLKQCTLVFSGQNGCAARTAPIEIGTITSVMEGGAGDLLEVALSESFTPPGDDLSRVRLVPFKKEFIGDVDLERKTVQLMHLWVLE